MPKAININGGMGRVVAALPALCEYTFANPDTMIVMNGWDEIYDHTLLPVIEAGSAALPSQLEDYDIITPEPYHQAGYRAGNYNMQEAFAKDLGVELTQTTGYLIPDVSAVKKWMKHFTNLEEAKGKKLAMIQVKASGTENQRDLNEETTLNAIKALKDEGYFPVLIGNLELSFGVECHNVRDTNLADYIALIAIADIFVGGDSSGMHIAYAVGTKGIIFYTTTAGITFYPDWFVEFRHPDFPDTKEFPRFFRGEQKQMKKNQLLGPHRYSISEEMFKTAIEDIRG